MPVVALPDLTMNSTMTPDTAIIRNGIAFMKMPPGITLGTSGGGSRWTSPPGLRGAASRGIRLNCSVLTEEVPLA
jgi:hypothetical protein